MANKEYELVIKNVSMDRLLQIGAFADFVIDHDLKNAQLLIEPLEEILGQINAKMTNLTNLDLTNLGIVCESLAIKIKDNNETNDSRRT